MISYPSGYRSCPVCGVGLGMHCKTVAATVINGTVQGPSTKLDHPHVARKTRTRR